RKWVWGIPFNRCVGRVPAQDFKVRSTSMPLLGMRIYQTHKKGADPLPAPNQPKNTIDTMKAPIPKFKGIQLHLLSLGLILVLAQTSLAQQQTTLELPGLLEPVEILRDAWGVNHIYANNDQDLFFAQGYAAAKDRLFQFEMWRRQATGTVAEV